MKLLQRFYEFVNSCNQVTIHFAGLASTKFSNKKKQLLNLVFAKFMHIKVTATELIQLSNTPLTVISRSYILSKL